MNTKNVKAGALLLLSFISASAVYASAATIGSLAYNVTGSFAQIGSLMTGVAYLAGLGFGISAVFKFKQHKDNPTQIPIGTPFALLAVSVILIFLPGIYAPAGQTIFGGTGDAGGFTGAGASQLPGGST